MKEYKIRNDGNDPLWKVIIAQGKDKAFREGVRYLCFDEPTEDLGKPPVTTCVVPQYEINRAVRDALRGNGLMDESSRCKIKSGFRDTPFNGGVIENDRLDGGYLEIKKHSKLIADGNIEARISDIQKKNDKYDFDGTLDLEDVRLFISAEDLGKIRNNC